MDMHVQGTYIVQRICHTTETTIAVNDASMELVVGKLL